MKVFLVLAITASAAWSQASVSLSQGPPQVAVQKLFYYDGGNNLQYICNSPQTSAQTTVQRSDSSLTNIVVLTNVGTVTTANAHGLYIGARVVITGATVDTDLNGTYTVASVPTSTTYTIATAAVANATYTDAGLVISTFNPLTTRSVWAITVLIYDGSNLLTDVHWANFSTAYALACTSRTSY